MTVSEVFAPCRPARTQRPVLQSRLPPCNNACAAGENIQGWLALAESGDFEAAWRLLTEDNPLPACMGRICYHPCESHCNRGELDAAVSINAVERFLGDEAIRCGWRFPPPAKETGKRVLVVGAGPSGLSAAYHLRRLGHTVVVQDAEAAEGGMMRFGIPQYRLPRDVLDAEVKRIAELGVAMKLGARIDDVRAAKDAGHYDAVFLAVGAHVAKHTAIPAGTAARILDAVSVLHATGEGETPLLGRRVAVYGGGNTALDVARTAKRLGAEDAVIIYRRTRAKMPAHDFEVEEAREEGVRIKWLSTVKEMEGGHITVEKMTLDETGFPQPTGKFETLDADSVVLALGQDVDLGLLKDVPAVAVKDGVVQIGSDMMTGADGIFAGGDMVPSQRTATIAVGHGKAAAFHIDAWLAGGTWQRAPKREPATFDRLNTWYYANAPRSVRPTRDASDRSTTFDEVFGGMDGTTAICEARRCLSCGNCFECDNCYGLCPDNAVVKVGTGERYAFGDACSGCGLCAQECPCGAITMVPETH